METLLQDLRYGLRMLVKSPGFTAVAILTLALGIGANTAIFSVVNGLLLHPVGIPHPERLVAIRARYETLNLKSIVISAPDFAFVRDNKQVFAAAALQMPVDFNYTGGEWPLHLRGAKVSWQWFDVFEARPLLGRVFSPEEDQPHADHDVVLAYDTWKNFFGADAGVIDRTIQLNQEAYRVIGGMGPDFEWPSQTDLWAPIALAPADLAADNFFNENFFAVARTQPGVSASQAAAYMDDLTQEVIKDPRSTYAKDSGWGLFSVALTKFIYGDIRTPLFVLLGAVGFVILIACANVAGLLLARASGRAREFAVRTALGASPGRLVRQTLTEGFLLAFAGMALGLAVASFAIQALLSLAPNNLANGLVIHMDGYVLLFTMLLAGAAALAFGAAPAWQISRTNPQQNLSESRGAGGGTRAHHRFRDALVVGELALALVLLAGAGIFLKSLFKLKDVNVGFRPQGLMTAALSLPQHNYDTPAKQIGFLRLALERLANSPGVVSAAAGAPLPFSGYGGSASFRIEGYVPPPGDPGPHGDIRIVSPAYFATLGIPIIGGREFTNQDSEGTERVAVIDENLAKQYWPNEEPIGKRIRNGSNGPWATIVGIVAHVRHSQVVGEEASAEGVESSGKGVYYYPLYQTEAPNTFLVARTNGNSTALAATIREAVRAVDPNQPISDLKTMDQRIALSMGPRRAAVALLACWLPVRSDARVDPMVALHFE